MKKIVSILFISSLLLIISNLSFAQNASDSVLINIGEEKVFKSEFLNTFFKNQSKTDKIDKKALGEYLELFINFKLKVKESFDLKMDTASAFVEELSRYRAQLAQPYLMDKTVNEILYKEAFDRMQYDIKASHILIRVSPNALPKDTLVAYEKIKDIRNRILKGESFEKLAVEISDDPSAKDQPATKERPEWKGNKGDIGYFTVFDLFYPFETGAYNLKVGEISEPVKTQLGYHLIKVTDKKPAMGKVKVAHILALYPQNATKEDSIKAKLKIEEINAKLKNGEKFEDLAKQYSDDKGSGANGGELKPFGTFGMVPEFVTAIGGLKNIGDISQPIQTYLGWHIIKLLERKDLKNYEEQKPEIKQRVARDARYGKSKDAVINKIKQEYAFKENKKMLKDFYKVIDTTYFNGSWTVENAAKKIKLDKELFVLAGKVYTNKNFAEYLKSHQGNKAKENPNAFIEQLYKQFVDETCIVYEDSQLENKYPEFKNTIREYKEGILLFNLTEKKVWEKALTDSIGIDAFYNKIKNNYMWGERVNAAVFKCSNKKVADQTKKLIEKSKNKTFTKKLILDEINKESQLNLQIDSAIYSKKDHKIIDTIEFKIGLSKYIEIDKSVYFAYIYNVLPPMPKTLNEVRGLVTSEYQTYLEKEWIAQLKNKYQVYVNRAVFSTIK